MFRFALVTRGPRAPAIKGSDQRGRLSRRPDLLIFIRGPDCSTLPLKLTVVEVADRFVSDYATRTFFAAKFTVSFMTENFV